MLWLNGEAVDCKSTLCEFDKIAGSNFEQLQAGPKGEAQGSA